MTTHAKHSLRLTFAMLVQYIKGRNEELVSILLLITRQVTGVCPH